MWIAHYIDGTELSQFSEGRERLFKDIELNKLESFELRVDSKKYEVNVKDGSLLIEDSKLCFENFGLQNHFDLIYFKRVRQHIGAEVKEETVYFLGWKTNIDNHAFKRILQIDKERVTLGLK
jgi:hypothetical protein